MVFAAKTTAWLGQYEAFLLAAPFNNPAFDGCFLVNASREPVEALTLVRNFRSAIVAQPGLNISEEDAGENRDVMADIIWSTLPANDKPSVSVELKTFSTLEPA
ncbi:MULTISPECIES: hypothetical protein [unclassified Leclercia]|uniref:hypothetical protein n=1 Tax=unclassified Leclercia TaxID=2627398 RepID=UPI000DF46DD4|nr:MULTISPECIES: hypothetical protein [unclassified Leclercia]AXF59355.1 hypothetical protein DVA43_07245 [Leclercia sp. W6]AXF64905.1 hypothetical protein DVA44_12725 [Leclercia sp. W17]